MSYYPSPPNASLANLKYYLKDEATNDANLNAFYQRCLDAATAEVYRFIRRDYTPSQKLYDVFYGNGTSRHLARAGMVPVAIQAGTFGALSYSDTDGSITVLNNVGNLQASDDWIWEAQVQPNKQGTCVLTKSIFYPRYIYYLYWLQPIQADMDTRLCGCPDAVTQIIIELAAEMFFRSSRGFGSLNTGTDFSNALGQSKLTFTTLLPEQLQRLSPFVNFGAYQ